MKEALLRLRPWVNFAGCVLVVAVLYWMQAILVPLAFAILLAFVLTPLVVRLQRWIGRVAAVLVTVGLAFTALGLSGWGFVDQTTRLIAELPEYRSNIRQKIADIRQAGEGSSVEVVQETLEEIQTEIEESDQPRGTIGRPFIVRPEQVANFWRFPGWLGPVIGPLTTAGLVIVLVIFLLLERDALRGRLLTLIGAGHLAATTKAIDEAGRRVSRLLLMQTCVNLLYGIGVGIGLRVIGVPYSFLWAALATVLRFVPYVGPLLGAAGPILVGLAALPGWGRPMWVVALFVGLELFTNLVLETVLIAGAAGVSSVALLIALTFWTWLWGPMGLLMATPLTICVAVLGKHVPGIKFLSALMADAPSLAPEVGFYQRLLAHDPSEASDIIDRHLKTEPPETLYDKLLLPALSLAKRDRLEGRLSAEEEQEVVSVTRELMSDASAAGRSARDAHANAPEVGVEPGADRVRVLAWPANATSDELALRMLGHLLEDSPVELEVISEHALSVEIVATVKQRDSDIVCIADLPPGSPSRTRYLIKKLRTAFPDLKILAGGWAEAELVDEHPELLVEAGPDHVGSTLIETRDQLWQLARFSTSRSSAT